MAGRPVAAPMLVDRTFDLLEGGAPKS